MARSASSRKRSGSKRRSRRSVAWGRWLGWAIVVLCCAAVLAVPIYRWSWNRDEGNLVRVGMKVLRSQGCLACHVAGNGSYRWRQDGASPASIEAVRDAVMNGRRRTAGFAAAMPAYGGRLSASEWQGAVLAVGTLAGFVGVPEDQELAAGRDVAVQMGCFGCHGPGGAGTVANPGSLAGSVPGWFGSRFRRAAESDQGIQGVLRSGARQAGVPLPGLAGPALVMPPLDGRIDSTELSLLVRYLQWAHANPPAYGE